MDGEIWKDVAGYEGYYQVSNFGRVRSCRREIVDSKCVRILNEKILKPTESNGKQPYYYISLSKHGKVRKRMVHILVANAFIPNPNNKPQVNHIDGNPQNNHSVNLEWVTNAENTKHAYDNHLRKKRVVWVEHEGETISLMSLCNKLGINYKRTYSRYVTHGWTLEKAIIKKNFKGGDVKPCQE